MIEARRQKASAFQQVMQQQAADKNIVLDEQQLQLIARMDALIAPLLTRAPQSHHGLYIWGEPGRGKSFIADAFFNWAPLAQKKRVHFHLFFRELHQIIARGSRVEAAIEASIGRCQLLCFDEFHLHDIGDAMLIKPLLEQLFQRGVLLIATSNQPPEKLLANPLYHQRFVSSIALIRQQMEVIALTGEKDYRTLNHAAQGAFSDGGLLVSATLAQRQRLGLPAPVASPLPLKVGYRTLETLSPAQAFLHFSFSALCEAPTAVMDYLQLCEQYPQWLIEDVPPLARVSPAVQQRFINVIDVLYDRQCRLFLITDGTLSMLTQGVELEDIQRTWSRLNVLPVYQG
ncbi:cell division protein ZapE [Mixta theicola]|uniref:Cell division protein ZapE n=1 Tax=Mixta theicola TaxID=1458355 RepID=A0A2K1QCB0_9GAMM|nr:cell division protein ZapE [Mixta theicola]PNS12668.1 cell division protein ZapE [Mixta theicola]